ncbi:3925_t:CDS:2 [Funneliformis geosporum]|nr:3925_t:CDS:2 [Funneliformis geosporum]
MDLTLQEKQKNQPILTNMDQVLGESENDKQDNQYNLNERIENLKKELKEQQKLLTVTKYNKKRAILNI